MGASQELIAQLDGPVPFKGLSGRFVVVMDEDGYYWMSAVTESIIEQGRMPVIAARVFEVGRERPMVSRIAFLREVERSGGTLKPNAYVARACNGSVVFRSYLTQREQVLEDVAAVVWVGAARPRSDLAGALLAPASASCR